MDLTHEEKNFFILGFIVLLGMFFFLGNLIVSFTNIQHEESRYSVDRVKHSSDKEEPSKKLKKDM